MDGALNSKPTKNGGGLLRTTTWGCLIALSILVAALGLTGQRFLRPLGRGLESGGAQQFGHSRILGSRTA